MPHPLLSREKARIVEFRREVYKRLPSNDGFMRRLLSRHGILRLEIFVRVIPIVISVVLLRLVLEVFADFSGVIPSTAVTPFAGTCMFLIAVCIGGVSALPVCLSQSDGLRKGLWHSTPARMCASF